MSAQIVAKTVVSVAEMARMLSLSRARLYQLIAEEVFPTPVYHPTTRRPYYTEEMQRICLEVRRRNCGINGQPTLFYAPRHPLGQQPRPVKKAKVESKRKNKHADLLDGLLALGLEVTAAQIEPVMAELFPAGVQDLETGEVIRTVFLKLKRQNSAHNVGR